MRTNNTDPLLQDEATLLQHAKSWWNTGIIEIRPNHIKIKGRPIEDLIGNMGYAGMVWHMLRDDTPTQAQLFLLEAALIAAVDHGPQAPSIAIARMSITCGTSLNGAMASAINVLDDIHGGAGEQCLELFNKIVSAIKKNSRPDTLNQQLILFRNEKGKYIPGFGHRFHTIDPRAIRLLALVDQAVNTGSIAGHYANIARQIETTLSQQAGKQVPINIDGATAVIYGELGFDPELARGLFVLSRSVGILAHAWEQKKQGGRIKGPIPPELGYKYTGL